MVPNDAFTVATRSLLNVVAPVTDRVEDALRVVNEPARGVTAPITTLLIWLPPPETVPPKVNAGRVELMLGTPVPLVTSTPLFAVANAAIVSADEA